MNNETITRLRLLRGLLVINMLFQIAAILFNFYLYDYALGVVRGETIPLIENTGNLFAILAMFLLPLLEIVWLILFTLRKRMTSRLGVLEIVSIPCSIVSFSLYGMCCVGTLGS